MAYKKKEIMKTQKTLDDKVQLIVLGILAVIAAIVIACMNHAGVIHFDKYLLTNI